MAHVTIELPPALRPAAGGLASDSFEAASVSDLLSALGDRYPRLREQLLTPNGRLRGSVLLYLDGEDIRYRERERTILPEGSTVTIVRAIAGG
jgi:sulfur-carrier protein